MPALGWQETGQSPRNAQVTPLTTREEARLSWTSTRGNRIGKRLFGHCTAFARFATDALRVKYILYPLLKQDDTKRCTLLREKPPLPRGQHDSCSFGRLLILNNRLLWLNCISSITFQMFSRHGKWMMTWLKFVSLELSHIYSGVCHDVTNWHVTLQGFMDLQLTRWRRCICLYSIFTRLNPLFLRLHKVTAISRGIA